MGFEPTIPVFERAKTIHALELAATVICCAVEYITVKRHKAFRKADESLVCSDKT
jgi:hypothetical protein